MTRKDRDCRPCGGAALRRLNAECPARERRTGRTACRCRWKGRGCHASFPLFNAPLSFKESPVVSRKHECRTVDKLVRRHPRTPVPCPPRQRRNILAPTGQVGVRRVIDVVRAAAAATDPDVEESCMSGRVTDSWWLVSPLRPKSGGKPPHSRALRAARPSPFCRSLQPS